MGAQGQVAYKGGHTLLFGNPLYAHAQLLTSPWGTPPLSESWEQNADEDSG